MQIEILLTVYTDEYGLLRVTQAIRDLRNIATRVVQDEVHVIPSDDEEEE